MSDRPPNKVQLLDELLTRRGRARGYGAKIAIVTARGPGSRAFLWAAPYS